MNTMLLLSFYGICMIVFGVKIGYFIVKMEKRYKNKKKLELVESFIDDMEKRQKRIESKDKTEK